MLNYREAREFPVKFKMADKYKNIPGILTTYFNEVKTLFR